VLTVEGEVAEKSLLKADFDLGEMGEFRRASGNAVVVGVVLLSRLLLLGGGEWTSNVSGLRKLVRIDSFVRGQWDGVGGANGGP
jgi:hypothetical protein